MDNNPVISPVSTPALHNPLPPSRSSSHRSISPTPSHRSNPITFRPHQARTSYDEHLDNILRELRMAPELFVELARQLMSELGIGSNNLKYPQQFMSSIQNLQEDYDNSRLPTRYRQPLLQNGRLARLRHLYSELSISSSARSLTNPHEPGASFHLQTPHAPETPPSEYPREWNPDQLQERLDADSPQNVSSYPSNRWYGPSTLQTIHESPGDRPRTPERSRSLFSPHPDDPLSYASASEPGVTSQVEIIPPRATRYASTPSLPANALTPGSYHPSHTHEVFERHAPPHMDNVQHPPPAHHLSPQTDRRSTDMPPSSHHSQGAHRSQSHHSDLSRQHYSHPLSTLPHTRDQPAVPTPQMGYSNALGIANSSLQTTGLPGPTPATPLNSLLTIESKIEVRKPDPFDGTIPRKWKTFITECMITFQAKPNTYQNDQHRVAFASSWLKGNPLTHYSSLLTHSPQHPALSRWSDFTTEFGRLFGPVNTALDAEFELQRLFMAPQERFTSFITRFELEAFETGWNYNAISAQLRRALPNRMRNALQFAPPTSNYHELKAVLAQIDLQHWIRESEDRLRLRTSFIPRQQSSTTQDLADKPHDAPTDKSAKRTPQQKSEYTPATDEQKAARRKNGECVICGSSEHWASEHYKKQTARATFIVDGETFEETTDNHYEIEHDDDHDAEHGDPQGNEDATQALPGEI